VPSPLSKTGFATTGGVIAAVGSALCCAGPLVAVALGFSGAGLAKTFEPLRPYFVISTFAALGSGYWLLRREDQRACEPGKLCASPVVRRRMRWMLWVATAIVVPLVTFPWWSPIVFQ
jgi:mercuric ion transport protein